MTLFCQFYRRPVKYNTLKPKEPDPMKTDTQQVFLQIVSVALAQLKQRLQQDYELAYPGLREIWDLSSFPHLLLPELVEAHITNLNLQPAEAKHADLIAPRDFNPVQTYQPAVALCG
ncbi:MAG: hypothetical protein DMF39_01220 [Verrucomicrobia bacterium]|nr:MAG: hypothetical protein DMF39_01220 [Verrucomicrobiota bacterium]